MKGRFEYALIVEDNFIEANKLNDLCNTLGLEVVSIASTEDQAVDRAIRFKPDVIFMDINLGQGGNGINAANQISSAINIPIIYTSAYDDTGTIEKAVMVKPYGYILKPFNAGQFTTAVRVAEERFISEQQERITFNKLKLASELSALSVIEVDPATNTLQISGSVAELKRTGTLKLEELLNVLSKEVQKELLSALKEGDAFKIKAKLTPPGAKPNQHRWIRLALSECPVDNSEVRIGAIQDITEMYSLEHKLLVSDTILDEIQDGIVVINSSNIITQTNAAFCQFFGKSKEQIVNHPLDSLVELNRSGDIRLVNGVKGAGEQISIAFSDGKKKHFLISSSGMILDAEGQQQAICTFTNITELKEREMAIKQLAYIDPLTKAGNRNMLRSIYEDRDNNMTQYGLIIVDLDYFKQINDTYGHIVGDEVLKICAERLYSSIRDVDTVIRYGGDEFMIIVTEPKKSFLNDMVRRISESLEESYPTSAGKVKVTVSIGVSESQSEKGLDALLSYADSAMYRAKMKHGKNSVVFFSKEFSKEIENYLIIKQMLDHGVEHLDFVPYFQPIISRDVNVEAVESLVRLRHSRLGNINPEELMSVIEEVGQAQNFGLEMFRRSCADFKKVQDKVENIDSLVLSVNFSPSQLQENLANEVLSIADEFGISHSQLRIEITETSIKNTAAIGIISELAQAGISVYVDDFGKGYTGLPDLIEESYSGIKFDKSLLHREMSKKDKIILKHLTMLAADINIATVLEGVETESQLAEGMANGCQSFQGFYFAKPMPAVQLIDYLSNFHTERGVIEP